MKFVVVSGTLPAAPKMGPSWLAPERVVVAVASVAVAWAAVRHTAAAGESLAVVLAPLVDPHEPADLP